MDCNKSNQSLALDIKLLVVWFFMELLPKLHRKWKFKDTICFVWGEREESGQEIYKCNGFEK